jgi:hypothetical protein
MTLDAASDDEFDSLATVSIPVTPATVLLTTEGFESGNYSGDTGWRNSWARSGEVSIHTNADVLQCPRPMMSGLWTICR